MAGSKDVCAEQLAKKVEELQERLDAETSQRKELEAALQASEQDLQAARQKAEEMSYLKSSLLTNMSHELRTPLTSILAHASLLESRLDGDTCESARAIKRGGERLTETLNSVLTLAQLEGKALEPVTSDIDLVGVLAQSLETLRPVACDKGLWLRTSLDADELTVHSDPRCLRRILNNLIGNAIKFTEKGGVDISIHADNELVIQVSDTGVGIGSEFLDQAFNAFTQESSGLTRTHEGTGLGLAITRHLVHALGGEISVESQKGVGTAFTVHLPCTQVRAAAAQAPAVDSKLSDSDAMRSPSKASEAPRGRAPKKTRGQMSVLLVEDNRDIRRVLEGLLDTLGDIVVCPDAESGLEHARRRQFEVVLMDISLPKMSGVQALEKLRALDSYKDTPIIAMTGHALPGDRERLLELGFTDYIGKPFSPSALKAILRSRVQI